MEKAVVLQQFGARCRALGWVLGWGLCVAGPGVSHTCLKGLLSSPPPILSAPRPPGTLRLTWTSLAGLAARALLPTANMAPTCWHRTVSDLDGAGPWICSRCRVQWGVTVGWASEGQGERVQALIPHEVASRNIELGAYFLEWKRKRHYVF